MNAGDPDPQRVEVVRSMLAVAIDAVGPSPADLQRATDILAGLIEHVDELGGDPALFELAWACASTIAREGSARRGGDLVTLSYAGFGEDPTGAAPDTPQRYLVHRFVNAVMNVDREAARRAWRTATPTVGDRVQQSTADLLAQLFHNAWSRVFGGGLAVTFNAGDPKIWPPPCDFCLAPGAARWMWHADPDTVVELPDLLAGPTTVTMADMQFWYGCQACRPDVARRPPDWEAVWRRHRARRPGARRPDVMAMYRAFQQARRSLLPVPLPAARPQPR